MIHDVVERQKNVNVVYVYNVTLKMIAIYNNFIVTDAMKCLCLQIPAIYFIKKSLEIRDKT